MSASPTLSLILPVYNEQDNIAETLTDILDYLESQSVFSKYEVIAVDDGSNDRTPSILDQFRGRADLAVITHPDNMGYGSAMVSGIAKAQYDWVLLMDSDGQFRIRTLQKMTEYLGDFDIITGYRRKRADPFYREFLGSLYTKVVCTLFGLNLRDVNCGFKLFRKEALLVDSDHCHAGAFYTNIFIRSKKAGHSLKEIPVEHYPRKKGKQTGVSFNVVVNALKDLSKLVVSKETDDEN